MKKIFFGADDEPPPRRSLRRRRPDDGRKRDRDVTRAHDDRSVNGRRAQGRDRRLPRRPRRRGPGGRDSRSGPSR